MISAAVDSHKNAAAPSAKLVDKNTRRNLSRRAASEALEARP